MDPATNRIAAIVFGVMLLGACTRHEERHLTPWLRVDLARPRTGSSGVIVLGSRAEHFHVKTGDRWVRLGTGHSSSYLTLANDQAALVDLHDGKGLYLLRAGRPPQLASEALGRSGGVIVPPGREVIDVFDCRVRGTPAGCRDAQIDRFDLNGKRLATFSIALPDAYSDCQILRIDRYDNDLIPYVIAQCKPKSDQPKCVLLAPRDDAPFLYAVGVDQAWRECSDLSRAGISLRQAKSLRSCMGIEASDIPGTIAIGIGATLLMDLWNLFLKRTFNIPSLNYCLLGRWLRHVGVTQLIELRLGNDRSFHSSANFLSCM